MALIKCSECGKEISDKAHHCPHCGNVYRKRTLQTKKEKSLAFKILIPIISSIAAFVFFIMAIILIDKVPEKIQEKKILNQIVGSWKFVLSLSCRQRNEGDEHLLHADTAVLKRILIIGHIVVVVVGVGKEAVASGKYVGGADVGLWQECRLGIVDGEQLLVVVA